MPKLYFENPSYNLAIVVCLIIVPAIVNFILNGFYNKMSNYKNSLNKNGKDIITYYFNKNKLPMIEVYPTESASYLDSYSSKNNYVFLNAITYASPDVSSFSRVIYLISPVVLDNKERKKYNILDSLETAISILYILIGPGFLWFGLLFKLNVLIIISLISSIIYFLYRCFTYCFIKNRINLANSIIDKLSNNEDEKTYIKTIYKYQKILYLLSFFLESCKLFNFLLPKNMKKYRMPFNKQKK